MKIRFWGVRGSHPMPLTPAQIRGKIAAVVQRIQPHDLVGEDSRQRFLACLPEWLFGTVGGNTTCIEVYTDTQRLLLDAGTGLVPFSRMVSDNKLDDQQFSFLFSHFHYDHVQGLPFFAQAYDPNAHLRFFSPEPSLEQAIKKHMEHPFFPVTMDEKMTKKIDFVVLPNKPVEINDMFVQWRLVNHPGRAYAYRIANAQQSVILVPDVELLTGDFEQNDGNVAFFGNVGAIVIDTMYTLGEAIERFNWGHSSFSLAVDFAHAWRIPKLIMFHHEPRYDDQKLYSNLRSAQWYADRLTNNSLQVVLAREGLEVAL